MQHHTSIPVVAAAQFKPEDIDFDAPYIVSDIDLKADLAKHESVIACWIAGFDRSVHDVATYLKEEASTKVMEPTAADISATLKFADSQVVTALRARGSPLHHAEIRPNQLLFQPAGWWVLEVPCNLERNFGVQVSVLPTVTKESKSFASFCAMKGVRLKSLAAGAVLERTKTCPPPQL